MQDPSADRYTRVRRSHRERDAPGLRPCERARLRAKWIKQRRLCAYYCTNVADTIDHVLPLVRGGTNYEGNLVPCCKACNSSKAGLTIIEWRTGKRLRHMTYVLPPKPPPNVIPKQAPEPRRIACPLCSTISTRQRYCSTACAAEAHRRRQRDTYRTKQGLPVDPTRATKLWQPNRTTEAFLLHQDIA